MRPKVLIVMVILPTLILAIAVFCKIKAGSSKSKVTVDGGASVTASTGNASSKDTTGFETPLPPMTPLPAPVTAAPVAPPPLTDEDRQNLIYAELDRLSRAYTSPDSNSQALIMADLTNSEPQIRAGAVEAAKQLGDKSMIPALTNLAATVEDYEDRHAILAAADFIALPQLADVENSFTPDYSSTMPHSPHARPHSSLNNQQPTTTPDSAATQPNQQPDQQPAQSGPPPGN
jgi:hypothetical protein